MMKFITRIKPEFKQQNLTAIGGLNPVFQFFDNDLNLFGRFDRQVTIRKDKRDFSKVDYFKVVCAYFVMGLEKLDHLRRFKKDRFLLRLLKLERLMRPENINRCFLSRFQFKHTHQLGLINATLLKKNHRAYFAPLTGSGCTIDVDSTPRNTSGHQEATGIHYKKHNGYHPIVAFIAETKEALHGYLRPGNTYTANGALAFLKECLARLPYAIRHILFRADSGFFMDELMTELEDLGHQYVIAAVLYPTLISRIQRIPDRAYRPFDPNDPGAEITTIHFRLPSWKRARKFVILRTLQGEASQTDMFNGTKLYTYRAYCANTDTSADAVIETYRQRGNSENYIKELKADLNMESTTFQPFWENEAFFQTMLLVYNAVIWFKAACIGVKEAVHQRMSAFRFNYIMVPAKFKTGSRQPILSFQRDFEFKDLFLKLYERVFPPSNKSPA